VKGRNATGQAKSGGVFTLFRPFRGGKQYTSFTGSPVSFECGPILVRILAGVHRYVDGTLQTT